MHDITPTRRGVLRAGVGIAAGLSLSDFCGGDETPRRKPNILFIMDDQHRGDALGAAGNGFIQTPNLDKLAAEGARFAKAYSSVPSCPPARAAILTGLDPWGHGMLGYTEQATRWPYVMPRAMNDAGYETRCIGKNHFHPWRNTQGYMSEEIYDGLPVCDGKDDYGLWLKRVAPGVDEHSTGLSWNDRRGIPWPHKTELHPTAWVGERAVDWLRSFRSEKPFFLKVSFHRPHSPFDPPKHWWEHYARAELPKAVVGAWAEQMFGKFTSPTPPEAPRANIPEDLIRNSRQGYYGGISFVDEQIGRLIDVLKKRDLLENTLILFVADHGDMVGDQHLWRKTYPYEGSAHIPMIVRWGEHFMKAKRGQVLTQLSELRDVLPTCLDAAGVAPAKKLAGQSLLKLIRGDAAGWRSQLDLEHSTCYWAESPWNALTDGRFKYIYYAYTGRQLLFDLQADPAELNDLSTDPAHARTLADWRQKMIAHLAERGDRWVANGDLTIRKQPIHRGPNFPEKGEAKGVKLEQE